MENQEILNALGNLIQNQVNKNNMDINIAYQNFIQKAKCTCRESTISYYNKKFKLLKETLSAIGVNNLSDINKVIYNKLILILKNSRYKNNTINKVCDLLKSIFKTNVELGFIQSNPLAGIKKLKEDNVMIIIIKKLILNRIFDYLFNLKENFYNIRNTLAILLLNDTGVRINELVHVKWKNINIEENTIYLDFTKTIKTRFVYFQEVTKKYMLKYLSYHSKKCEYLFITKKDTQMNVDSVYDFISQIKQTLNIENSISPHKWRHTFATKLIEENVNLDSIMKVLGHTQYTTTARYLHQQQTKIKNDILKAIKKR
ncbi:MAG: site-specific integrase [Anaeroplasmataceae bacterium]|nr:site-specific integrase [Anaeroplasmataceae bacterium]